MNCLFSQGTGNLLDQLHLVPSGGDSGPHGRTSTELKFSVIYIRVQCHRPVGRVNFLGQPTIWTRWILSVSANNWPIYATRLRTTISLHGKSIAIRIFLSKLLKIWSEQWLRMMRLLFSICHTRNIPGDFALPPVDWTRVYLPETHRARWVSGRYPGYTYKPGVGELVCKCTIPGVFDRFLEVEVRLGLKMWLTQARQFNGVNAKYPRFSLNF
jgi:hypothetical protein